MKFEGCGTQVIGLLHHFQFQNLTPDTKFYGNESRKIGQGQLILHKTNTG